MLERYQVLISDWLAAHLKDISEKYDISFSEAVRVALCLQIPKFVSIAYPECKIKVSDKELVKTIKKASRNKAFREDLHKLFSSIYFEARKVVEFWTMKERKRKQVIEPVKED